MGGGDGDGCGGGGVCVCLGGRAGAVVGGGGRALGARRPAPRPPPPPPPPPGGGGAGIIHEQTERALLARSRHSKTHTSRAHLIVTQDSKLESSYLLHEESRQKHPSEVMVREGFEVALRHCAAVQAGTGCNVAALPRYIRHQRHGDKSCVVGADSVVWRSVKRAGDNHARLVSHT